MAYLTSQFESKKNHLEFVLRGFNDSISSYVNQFFNNLATFDPVNHEDIFNSKLENIKLKYKNFFL